MHSRSPGFTTGLIDFSTIATTVHLHVYTVVYMQYGTRYSVRKGQADLVVVVKHV